MDSEQAINECRAEAALYALGGLDKEAAQAFEHRLESRCPFCTAELSQFAEVASQIAMSVPAKQPPASLRNRVLERIRAAQTQSAKLEMTLVRADDSPWVPLPTPGAEMRSLLGHSTFLVRMQPGSVLPEHHHGRNEQCFVLEGSVTDSNGVTAYAGDFVCMYAGSTHEPIHTDTGCLLLLAYTA